MKTMLAVSVLVVVALGAALATAATTVVDVGGSGDYTAIQPALTAASEGDTILVMPGTYTGEDNMNLDFDGTNVVLRSSDGAATTIIDCEDYTKAIFLWSGDAGPTTVIDGFTFTRGHATAGGLVYCWQSSPAFIDCVFSNSFAINVGGAVYLCESTASFTRCVFTGNESEHGGAVQVELASPTFTDCEFTSNTSTGEGGGVDVIWEALPTFTDCVFSDNSAATDGGGLRCYDNSSPTLTGCSFTENSATAHGGGAFCDSTSSPTIASCLFQDNTSNIGGGISCRNSSSPSLTNCTFTDNGADEGGGTVHCWNANPVFTNCIIAYSTSGPALACEVGTESPLLLCCDLYGNAGGDWVGCIADQATTGGNVSAEPLFCDRPSGDLTIDTSSVCAAAHSGGCGLIGALDVGCDSPVHAKSWGEIKSIYR